MDASSSASLRDYYTRERETLLTEPVIRAELLALGVTGLRADYDGAGDEGQINDIFYFDGAEPVEGINISADTQGRVEDLLYALLTCRHTGWDQGDGAFGHFEWDLTRERLEHEHNDRVLTYITSVQMGFRLEVEQDDPDAEDELEARA